MRDRIDLSALPAEEKQFAAHLADLGEKGEYTVAVSEFLTSRRQRIAVAAAMKGGFSSRLFFWGGTVGAERRCAVFLPDWIELPETLPACLSPEREEILCGVMEAGLDGGAIRPATTAVRLLDSGYRVLGHRDWLGALLAMGIRRDVLGDLAVLSDREAITFADERMADFLVREFTSAGADTVRGERVELPPDFRIPRRYEPVSGTVASPRLDSVVHVLTHLSRGDASSLIAGGSVTLNDFAVLAPDKEVYAGDVVVIRGYGKFMIDDVGSVTKKGRNRLAARKYQ